MAFKSCVPSTTVKIRTEDEVIAHIPSLLSWTNADLGKSEVQTTLLPIPSGITNTIFGLRNAATGDTVIVRIFGSHDIFNEKARYDETRIFKQLSDAGIAPRLRAIFGNGRVEQCIPAVPITLASMTDADIGVGVARNLARLHAFVPSENPEPPGDPQVWTVLQEWADTCMRSTMMGKFSDAEHFVRSHIERAVEALPRLRRELSGGQIVFAHNDLLAGNILRSVDGSVSFVDFEYSGWNYRCFDIGNYFAEAMGGAEDAVIQTNLYPDHRFRALFCEAYLRALHSGESPTEAAVNSLVKDAERYGLLSHIYWGIWAVVQSVDSTIDFPYKEYARQRLDIFFSKCDWA